MENIYICDECGTAEALLDFMNQKLPVSLWAVCKPLRIPSGFGSMTAEDVRDTVVREQIPTLARIYRQCLDDPDNAEDFRAEAFETCPGLTELWLQPFTVRYDSHDAPVMIRFRLGVDGETEFSADIVGK